MNNTLRFYSISLSFLTIGVVVGALMVYWDITKYEVIITTANIGFTIAVLYNQHHTGQNSMKKKQWQINMGLIEGYYNKGKTHKIEEVYDTFQEWIISRKKQNLPILSGSVQGEIMIYPLNETAFLEPSVVIKGELSPKFDKQRSDYEVIKTIESFATFLLIVYAQNRVYYSYRDVQYTVDSVAEKKIDV